MAVTKRAGRTRLALGLIADQRRYSVANNLREICRLAEEAGRMKCDLLATEEVALTLFCGGGSAVRVPGPEIRRIAALARKHRMYIAVGLVMKTPGGKGFRNSQVLLDRRGRIVGAYHKMQLTNGELQGGVLPGNRMAVFDTDFGRVAFMICYDSQFGEIPRLAGIKGADLILFPHVGGAVGGDLIGRAVAYGNTCWTATVGRYFNCVCDPRGNTVAALHEAGKLLVVDVDLKRLILPINPALDPLSWRTHQLQERRPEAYADLLGPSVAIESPQWPLYTGNELLRGPRELKFVMVNRSQRRQRGFVTAQFPVPLHVHTDEHVSWFIDQRLGQADWKPRPRRFTFDLGRGERKSCVLRYRVRGDAEGIEAVRISGRTADGDRVFWERQLVRFAPPPELHVPRVARPADVVKQGASLPMDRQFTGGRAGSRTDVRAAHDGQSLILHAVCHRYGPWHDETKPSPDTLSIPVMPLEERNLLFWCILPRIGPPWTQRRDGGHPVEGRKPRWSAEVKRGALTWTAFIRFPFKEFEEGASSRAPSSPGQSTSAGAMALSRRQKPRRWRFNLQRSAVLPDEINRARYMSEVVSPPGRGRKGHMEVGVEWATWNPPHSRIDCIPRLGTLIFE